MCGRKGGGDASQGSDGVDGGGGATEQHFTICFGAFLALEWGDEQHYLSSLSCIPSDRNIWFFTSTQREAVREVKVQAFAGAPRSPLNTNTVGEQAESNKESLGGDPWMEETQHTSKPSFSCMQKHVFQQVRGVDMNVGICTFLLGTKNAQDLRGEMHKCVMREAGQHPRGQKQRSLAERLTNGLLQPPNQH